MRLHSIGFHETRTSMPRHRDDRVELHYLLEGEGVFTLEGRERRVKPGHFFYTLPEENHHIRAAGGASWVRQYIVQLSLDAGDGELEDLLRGPLSRRRYFEVGTQRRFFFERIRRKQTCGKTHLAASARHELAAFLFECAEASGAAPTERQEAWIEGALAHFQRNLSGQVDLGALCRTLGVNREHFIRLFKRRIGHPPRRYFAMLKVEALCDLLSDPAVTLERAASDLGFTDASHLSRVFREWKGVSPGAWRRGAASGKS